MSTQIAEAADIDTIGHALEAIARQLSQGRVYERIRRQANVDVGRADCTLLYKFWSAGDSLRLGDLAERLELDAPTVTRRVQQLEARQLVQRVADPLDGRAQLVHLTPTGVRTVARLLAARRDWLARALGSWSDRHRADFGRLLERFVVDVAVDLDGSDGH